MQQPYHLSIYKPKKSVNTGSLFRAAFILDDIIPVESYHVIGQRFKPQASDTTKSHRHKPVNEWDDTQEYLEFVENRGFKLVAVELDDRFRHTWLDDFDHFPHEKVMYIMGAEDEGLPTQILTKCDAVIRLPGKMSLNVAMAGGIVLYDRMIKLANEESKTNQKMRRVPNG